MKVLMVSSDRAYFDEKSAVRARAIAYGSVLTELHIIVTTTQAMGFSRTKLADTIWLYPTNSAFKALMWLDAIFLGRGLPPAELVTSQDPFELGLAAHAIASDHSARLQLQIHTDFMSPHYRRQGIVQSIRVRIAKYLIPKADCVRVVSERIRTSLAGMSLRKEPHVLPIHTDIQVFLNNEPSFRLHTKYPQFNFIVLMMSRLTKEKDIGTGMRAFKMLFEKDSRAGLCIVGDGEEMGMLKRLAHELGIESNVVFAGWQQDTLSYLKSADVFLNTSLYEGYALTLIEAAASKRPIVTTNVGIAGEVLMNHKHALIAPVGDVKELGSHLISLMADNTLRERIAVNAHEEVLSRANITFDEYLVRMKDSFSSCF